MNGLTCLVLLALSMVTVDATIHTMCFNYFLHKDGCVNGAAGSQYRCGAKAKYQSSPVPAFGLPPKPKKGQHPLPQGPHHKVPGRQGPGYQNVPGRQGNHHNVPGRHGQPGHHPKQGHHPQNQGHHTKPPLERRYDTHIDIPKMNTGHGICGYYDTNKVDGVCLWSGPEQTNPTFESAGWLNSRKDSNCRKQVYIQRRNDPKTVHYVPVLDGCSFHAVTEEQGCFEIGVTRSLAAKLAIFPNKTTPHSNFLYGGFTWDFNNPTGSQSSAGPV
ncbi:hypothetical protein PGT21_006792 [Puccinia graminis f. sp. tritici]|uniref:Uncharacterized protein n=1 Tax=Puccinia graminis f. sp. tritici TaxID=56615 RepID=A0A5B0QZU6_PUCGR|nr:hypothetical protein PGT21_006792 [Puccinia graminis f. sp. tritici]